MKPYDWVSMGSIAKFNRAVLLLKKENKEVTEESVKELYLKYGGLCVGQPETQKGVEEGDISLAVMPEYEREEAMAKPVGKRGRK